MADYGYDKERFPNMTGDMFDCPICTNVVILPKECMGCGDLYCGKCIDDWMKKNKYAFMLSQFLPEAMQWTHSAARKSTDEDIQ